MMLTIAIIIGIIGITFIDILNYDYMLQRFLVLTAKIMIGLTSIHYFISLRPELTELHTAIFVSIIMVWITYPLMIKIRKTIVKIKEK